MFQVNTYLSPLLSLVSLWTMTGVLLHDVQIDAATIKALSSEKRDSQTSFSKPDPHTHPEHRSSLKQKNSQTRIQPKRENQRFDTTERKLKKNDYSLKP